MSAVFLCSKSKLTKPWYRANDTAERNEMARKAFEAVLTVTLRKPDSPEYRTFSDDVKARAKRDYNETIGGDGEVVHQFAIRYIMWRFLKPGPSQCNITSASNSSSSVKVISCRVSSLFISVSCQSYSLGQCTAGRICAVKL